MTMTAVAVPLEHPTQSVAYDMADSDVDAEGEEEPEDEIMEEELAEDQDEEDEEAEVSDAIIEADSDEEEEADAEGDGPGAGVVRTRKAKAAADSDEDVVEEQGSDVAESSAAEEDDSDKESSDAESAAAEPWEAASEGADTHVSLEVANRNNCVFCGQDEEHDPCEEFEEYMACSVCGDNSHRQCARDAKSFSPNEDASNWRCPDCVDNELAPADPAEANSRRRSSATKFTRDLLPAARGPSRPGSHSVFNTLILDDDPLDGSRSLRKRKASSEQQEEPKKRPRQKSVLATELEAVGLIPGGSVAEAEDEADVEEGANGSVSTRKSRSSRSSKRRISDVGKVSVSVVKKSTSSFVLSFNLDPAKLAAFPKPRPKKKRPRPVEVPKELDRPVPSFSSHYATPFYAFHERENDELKSKPYGGVLSDADADTSKTLPSQADRARFTEARQKAEEEWKLKVANSEAEGEMKARTQKLAGPPSKIKCVNFGGYEIETWYAAPYPEEYSRNRVLYICEFCLKYMNSDFVAWRHKLKCPAKHPPGDEIYRDVSISVFEVDGRKNPVYCQNLCLLAKLFLGSKTLYYDVEPFLFYVMTEYDEFGCHFVGYFSKEKRPSSQNNVSCILTLPTHQRKGYGNLLISFSYLLTRVEGKTGSPEKPLSDMGLVSYRNYWRLVLSYELIDQKEPLSILELSDRTGMTADDIVAALEGLRALVRDPVTKTYALRLDYDYFNQCIEEWESKQYITLDPQALVWTPYIMGRSNLAHYETAPPLPTVAPREDEENDKRIAPEEGVQQTAKANALAAQENRGKGNVMVDGDDTQIKVNGDAIDLSHPSKQFLSKDTDKIDPALSQLRASTSNLSASSNTPTKPPNPSPSRVNGISYTSAPHNTPSIPPVRYEVFPPIPGTTSRRRGGWRGGPRKSGTNGANTPNATPSARRSGTGLGKGKGKSARARSRGKSAAAVRRTRFGGSTDGAADMPKDIDSEEEEVPDKVGDEVDLSPEKEDAEEEPDAEADEAMEDVEEEEAVADADFDGEEAEESEGDSDAESAVESEASED